MNPVDFLAGLSLETRSLYLIHDEQGRIQRFLSDPNGRFSFIIDELKNANLTDYFEFPEATLPAKPITLPQKRKLSHHPFFYRLYTNLPQSSLITQPVDNHLRLGRITFYELGPDIITPNIGGVLIADRLKGTVAG